MANFKCTNLNCERHCKRVDYIQYRSKIKDGGVIYMDKHNNQIICYECKQPLEFIQPETNGFPQVITQTFNSMTDAQKKQVLTKRMIENDKRKGNEYSQFKEAVDRGEVGQYGK